MMDLNNITLLNQVVDSGSFTQAATNLGMTKSTVSRKLAELEEHLGVKLITRSTRKLGLTQEGEIFYQASVKVLDIMQQTELELTANQNLIRGHLNLAMPVEIGHNVMSDYINSFLKRYPEVSINLEMTNREVDIIGDGIDLYVQIGEINDSSLVARTIDFSERIIAASPEYLNNYGYIQTPEDLQAPHHQIKVVNAVKVPNLYFNQVDKAIRVNLPYRLKVNTVTACKSACLSGLGIASLPEFICREHINNGELVRILPDWDLPRVAISLVFPQNKLLPKRLRAFIDHVLERFESKNASRK
ncbi:LysR family transcriptional regulator [Aliivibrio fischeri]|uniref:Transcriptional regulator, LysR family protein n=2 Tax=Aliivibrio fischeri TaxID=668 RepID=A0AAV3EWC3_ALIFS|nr:transcriptional regulator, LysR family protein [Aliivibrio fischeri SR5]MUJ22836.1 LysR family transcriptional regulator [Aliivibrio fischeri]MUK60592.1 LysR family transcriptional regulator [Aliivibrio fischeri]MUL09950.1 LysR family transcriptional regulator [Aliivibrio fischeri]MUL14659.1 LysR family transcriptional regulator [Aliivibrio fischeri]